MRSFSYPSSCFYGRLRNRWLVTNFLLEFHACPFLIRMLLKYNKIKGTGDNSRFLLFFLISDIFLFADQDKNYQPPIKKSAHKNLIV